MSGKVSRSVLSRAAMAWPSGGLAAGLIRRLRPARVRSLPRPAYSAERQPGTSLYNGHGLRRFNLLLADEVAATIANSSFAFVLGGDCSVLLGALAGVRRTTSVSLVHIDGHSDFRHPGNYDASSTLGAVAGMDLALATGRGEALLTEWPGIVGALVRDTDVVQLGERESRDPDYAWPDIAETKFTRIDIFDALDQGMERVLARTFDVIVARDQPFWLHLDVDVLDRTVMPAVDSPGSPGFSFEQLAMIAAPLARDPRCAGATLTVFDPDLDPEGVHADALVNMVHVILGPGS